VRESRLYSKGGLRRAESRSCAELSDNSCDNRNERGGGGDPCARAAESSRGESEDEE
jgi:hypothetical protein